MIQRYRSQHFTWGRGGSTRFFATCSPWRSVGQGGDGNYNVGRYSNSAWTTWWTASGGNRCAVRARMLTGGAAAFQ